MDINKTNQAEQEIKQSLNQLDSLKIQSNSRRSSRYSTYMSQMCQFMLLDTENNNEQIVECEHCQIVYSYLFSKNKMQIRYESPDSVIEVIILNTTKCKDYLLVNIKYNKRLIENVSIFIRAQQSPFHQHCTFSSGNFANVYKAKIQNKPIAVKCFKINEEKDIFPQFMKCLKEYVIFTILIQFGAAPQYESIQGFNIGIYRNCIEFSMECCKEVFTYSQKMEQDLKAALVKLHNNNIVHFDIKPENICFSPRLNKFVFIDFGLSEIIPENLGETKVVSFKGSLGYCSQQMKACSRLYFGEVDPYYNDLHCLNQSLKVLKQLNLEQHEQQNLKQMGSQFKYLKLNQYLLNIDINKRFRNDINPQIEALNSYQQCQQWMKSLRRFNFSFEINLIYKRIQQKYFQLTNNKFHNITSNNQIQIKKLQNNQNLMQQQQILNYYRTIFQSQQNNETMRRKQYYVFTDIESIGIKRDDKIQYIQRQLSHHGINPTNITTSEMFRVYYFLVLKYLENLSHDYSSVCDFAHFLPSFILFELVSTDQIMIFYKRCLHHFEQSTGDFIFQRIWTMIIFKFLMAVEWIQCTFLRSYNYEQLQRLMFEQLQKSIKKTPASQVNLKTSQIHYILLHLASQIKRSSTIYSNCLLINTLEQLGIYRQIEIQLLQIIEYLVYLMSKKIPFSSINKKFFMNKFNSFILENKTNKHYKLYPYYFNVFHCFHYLSQNRQKWIQQRIRNSFSQFSFFRHTYIYYYNKQTIFDFSSLKFQIFSIAQNIQLQQYKDAYFHHIIKTFLYNKYGVFLTNEKLLNQFIFSLGESKKHAQYFLNIISQQSKEFHNSHEQFTSQIITLFRYFIGSLVSQIAINAQNYGQYSQKIIKNRKNPQLMTNQHQNFLYQEIKGRINERQNNLIQINYYLRIWEQIETPSCIICKIKHAAYLELLRVLKKLLQGSYEHSFDLFTRLIIENLRQGQQQVQFINEAMSIYFYFFYLRNVDFMYQTSHFSNLVISAVIMKPFPLYHIILNAYELFHLIFKQSLILNPLETIYNLILPTWYNTNLIDNTDICSKMQTIFICEWKRLRDETPPQIFQKIWYDHIFVELSFTINEAIQKKKDQLFSLLGYVLAIMNMFIIRFQSYIILYKFISLALQYQPKNIKQFYIGKFYKVFRKKVQSIRFQKFKNRQIWKLKLVYRKQNQNQLTADIKLKKKKGGILQKKIYSIFYEKIIKYTQAFNKY